jgi:hypothetical protein
MTPCMQPEPRSRRMSCLAVAWRCCAPSRLWRSSKVTTTISEPALKSSRRYSHGQARSSLVRSWKRTPTPSADWRVWQPGVEGHHRPDQGRTDRAAGCSLHRGSAHYHGGDGRRSAQDAESSDAGRSWRRNGRNGGHGLLIARSIFKNMGSRGTLRLSLRDVKSLATGAPNAHTPVRTKNQASCYNRQEGSI